MKNYKNVIFDLDGTLVDTADDVINSLKKTYELVCCQNIDINKSIIGPQIKEIILRISPEKDEKELLELIKSYRDYYDNCDFEQTKLYPGINKLLESLKDNDLNIFLATNKPLKASTKILSKLKINAFFQDIMTPDSLDNRKLTKSEMVFYLIEKNNIEKEETLIIGDGVSDLIAAKDINVDSLAVTYGYGEKLELLQYKPTYLVENLRDLEKILKLS